MKKSLIFFVGLLPTLALASGPPAAAPLTFLRLVNNMRTQIFAPLVSILLTVAVIVFFFGMVKYIQSLSEKEKKVGKDLMFWGVIALFVMVAVWGLVASIVLTIGLDNQTVPSAIVLPP